MENSFTNNFDKLNPEVFINAVEVALDKRMSGLASPLSSYINRVYELQAMDGKKYVAKFYRPGRWREEALIEEHDFLLDSSEDEIPVITPLKLSNGTTLGEVEGIFFAVFPKKFGRIFEILENDDWKRIGSIIGRLHNVGCKKEAKSRILHHPNHSTREEIDFLLSQRIIPKRFYQEFRTLSKDILKRIENLFNDVEYIRTHGDCHYGNILYRPGEGMMLIDFDDMLNAPPVQDLWLILPDQASKCNVELNLLLDGYEQFREFDYFSLRLIEPLRLMRMIYFLSWLAKQSTDYKFKYNFPTWGTDSYWRQEINDLQRQLYVVKNL